MANENEIKEMEEIIRADYEEWLEVTNCLPKGTSYYYECLGGAKDSAVKLAQNGYGNIKNLLLELADEYDDYGEKRFRDYEAFVNFAKKYGVEL